MGMAVALVTSFYCELYWSSCSAIGYFYLAD